MIAARRNAASWWVGLQPDPDRKRPGNRAALARLRRCATVTEAMGEEATFALFRRVAASAPEDLPAVALAAAVLAHVREDLPGQVARVVGPRTPNDPDTAVLKPLRFRRLMEASGDDERLTAFRRLVALAGGKLPVTSLAEALLDWSEHRRRRWIYDYWNADGPPVPSGPAPSPSGSPAP